MAGAQYRFILNVSDQANVNRFSIAAEEVKAGKGMEKGWKRAV